MKEIRLAVVKRAAAHFIFIDLGETYSGKAGGISPKTRAILAKKYPGLPILVRNTSDVGNLPLYSGDVSLIQHVRGLPLATFQWETFSADIIE